MANREVVQALTLSRRSVGEADRLVTFFTREHGLLRVLARGVRRIPSRRGGHLEPLTRVSALISEHHGTFFLGAVETEDYFPLLHARAESVASAYVLATAAVGLFEYEVSYPRVYAAIRRAWELFGHVTDGRRHLLEVAAVALMLREAGVMPQLAACPRCGETAPRGEAVLHPGWGGWACVTCLPGQSDHAAFRLAGSPLSSRELVFLKQLAAWPRRALSLMAAEDESLRLVGAVRTYLEGAALLPAGRLVV
jgi:DNA repair protein RecO (recombination protein O)